MAARLRYARHAMTAHALLHSDEIERYGYPPDNPFKTQRATMFRRLITQRGLSGAPGYRLVAPRSATDPELAGFHDADYIDAIRRVSRGDVREEDLHRGLGVGDCPIFAELDTYARLAVGASIVGAELITAGEVTFAFNPSGGYHHAMPDRAAGFCYLNDVVLACQALTKAGKRVACLDLDAHHGDGTERAFYSRRDVLTISLHESGKTLFPGTGFEDAIGEGEGLGYNVNLPLPAGTDDDLFVHAFEAVVPPLLGAYRPDVIVLEVGMDILAVDPLTHLAMTNNVLLDVLPKVRDAGAPILAVGGGGYHPEATVRGWAVAWSVLTGASLDDDSAFAMGGVFLGSSEWNAGLLDMRSYARPSIRPGLLDSIDARIDALRRTVFPLHGLA